MDYYVYNNQIVFQIGWSWQQRTKVVRWRSKVWLLGDGHVFPFLFMLFIYNRKTCQKIQVLFTFLLLFSIMWFTIDWDYYQINLNIIISELNQCILVDNLFTALGWSLWHGLEPNGEFFYFRGQLEWCKKFLNNEILNKI